VIWLFECEEALTNLYVGYLPKSKHKEGRKERKGRPGRESERERKRVRENSAK
jgi:hypothetical protein